MKPITLLFFQVLLCLTLATLLSLVIVFNPRLAWAKRSDTPDWVRRRMRPLTKEQTQDVPLLDRLGVFFKMQ